MGNYHLQPVYVRMMWPAMVENRGVSTRTIGVLRFVGPEIFSYRGLVNLVSGEDWPQAALMAVHPRL